MGIFVLDISVLVLVLLKLKSNTIPFCSKRKEVKKLDITEEGVIKRLRLIYRTIKESIVVKEGIDFSNAASSSIREGFLNGQASSRIIIYLRGLGCKWALEKSDGGCFMCGHYLGTSLGTIISPDEFLCQFKKEMEKYNFRDHPIVCVYNAGSFLNEEEMPALTRRNILRKLASKKDIKCVILESRPEFVTKKIIEEIEEELKGKRVEIGVGLELADNLARNVCINKGFNTNEYLDCAEVIKRTSVNLLTYVTIKPLFLNSDESAKEAIEAAKLAVSAGSGIISLEPTSLQKGTLIDYFYQRGEYTLPKGWDVIRVVEQIHNLPAEIRIGGFEFFPAPEIYVHNCTKCDGLLYAAIAEYNRSKDISVLSALDCSCKNEWVESIKTEESSPLLSRIAHLGSLKC